MTDRWAILRTTGARTLPLAASLAAAGFEVWTPAETAKRRKPRKPGTVPVQVAMAPTYVFVREDRLGDVVRLTFAPIHQHPAFSVMRLYGRTVFVRDAEIERLRQEERRAAPRRRRRTLAVGSSIRPSEGAYAGLDGIVTSSDGKYTLVAFGGWMDVQIETSILIGDVASTVSTAA